MNDRFRFRTPIYGADGKFKKFVYWNAENGFPATTCRIGDVFKEAEQCTGLKDKNGQLIYVGDIVKVTGDYMTTPSYLEGKLAKVVWEINCFCLRFPHEDESYFSEFWNYEVIGNIHENADLLEEKSEKPILLEDKNEQN